jgi:inward rectifier potassium channel
MAKMKHGKALNSVDNTGFSANSSVEGARLINKDGVANLRKAGIPFLERYSVYHSLLRLPRWKFFFLLVTFYTTLNLAFACIYFLIGIEHLTGTDTSVGPLEKFLEAFFFSSQSLTTVGYGHVAPLGILANAVAAFESLVGILSFAVVTGIFYSRFSRPRAYLMFSKNVLVAPYKGGRAIMFRLATYKNNHLTDVEAQLTAALHIDEGGKRVTRFYPVKLEISKVTSLALSWTIVHPLDEESPMYGFTNLDFTDSRLELIVNIKAFDDHFSNTVQQRSSYVVQDLVYGARYLPMFGRQKGESYTVLRLDMLDANEQAELPDPLEVPLQPPGGVAAKV